MGRAQRQEHNDNDIVKNESGYNDNDIVRDELFSPRSDILKKMSEYELGKIQNFMFGESNKYFGDCKAFVIPALKQVERFMYVWRKELDEETRKQILNYRLGYDGDSRTREYKEYTYSPAWRYVSGVIKLIHDYTCDKCEQQFNPAHLVVHHISYAHLGSELDNLDDVAVLCTDCHMKAHGIRRQYESEQ